MKVKYMGTADVRIIPIGDMAGGTLPMPLDTEIVWDRSNNWVVDTEDEAYATVPPELWDYIVLNDNFQNVSDFRQIPLNDHQRIFLAMKDGAQKTVAEEQAEQKAAIALLEEERLARVAENNAMLEARELEAINALQAQSKEDLRVLASQMGVDGWDAMTKAELVAGIRAAEAKL